MSVKTVATIHSHKTHKTHRNTKSCSWDYPEFDSLDKILKSVFYHYFKGNNSCDCNRAILCDEYYTGIPCTNKWYSVIYLSIIIGDKKYTIFRGDDRSMNDSEIDNRFWECVYSSGVIGKESSYPYYGKPQIAFERDYGLHS